MCQHGTCRNNLSKSSTMLRKFETDICCYLWEKMLLYACQHPWELRQSRNVAILSGNSPWWFYNTLQYITVLLNHLQSYCKNIKVKDVNDRHAQISKPQKFLLFTKINKKLIDFHCFFFHQLFMSKVCILNSHAFHVISVSISKPSLTILQNKVWQMTMFHKLT